MVLLLQCLICRRSISQQIVSSLNEALDGLCLLEDNQVAAYDGLNLFSLSFAEHPGGPGWIVGSELGGLTLNIVTRGHKKNKSPELDQDDHGCPVGIRGAYDRVTI